MQERRKTDPHIALLPLSNVRRERRHLCTLLPQGDSDIKRREQERRKKTTPSTTLFVVNFDVIRTRERDLADLFGRYGPLRRVQVRLWDSTKVTKGTRAPCVQNVRAADLP